MSDKKLIEQSVENLKKINENLSNWEAHQHSDNLLCKLLIKLGYKEVVDEYKKSHKFYA